VRYQVEGGGGARLAVEVPLASRLDSGYEGRAWVWWNPEWAYALPADQSAGGEGEAGPQADGM
jgi:hypothetical protein